MTNKAKAAAYTAYTRQCSENVRAIIGEYMSRRKLTNDDLAKAIGISPSAFDVRKSKPETFRLSELWRMYEALGVPEEQRKTIM